MKHFFSFIALIIMLFCGSANVNAQNREDFAFENTKTFVRQADDEFNRGSYQTAEFYYKQARSENYACKTKFIIPRELDQKIAECELAIKNGMSHKDANNQQTEYCKQEQEFFQKSAPLQ